jgi:transposase
LEARRLEAAALFAQGRCQADVVHQLNVSRQTASRWYAAWRRDGKEGLKGAGRAGRKPRLDITAQARLQTALLKGASAWGFPTELWTLDRVVHVIWKSARLRYSRPQAWRVLGQLGWSRQRPARRAKERDETAIARWVRHEWPRVKKTPAG